MLPTLLRRVPLAACILLVAPLSACQADKGGGTPTVAAAATPQVTVPGWRAGDPVSVGGVNAKDGEELFTVVSVAEDPEGRFYVLNVGDKRILVFDTAGTHLRTLGHEGRGPGEFVAPRTLAPVGSDGLYVLDLMQRRISRFRRSDGRHLSDVTVGAWKKQMPYDMRASLGGAVAVEFRPGPTIGGGRGNPGLVPVDTITGEVRAAEAVEIDTVRRFEATSEQGKARRVQLMDAPFAARPVWAVDQRGAFVFGTGSEYAVFRAEQGKVQEVFRRPAEPLLPVTNRDREEWFGQPTRESLRGKVSFPKHKPFYAALLVDPAGLVWLNVPSGSPGRMWAVHDGSGRSLGKVTFAPGQRLMHVSRGSMYVVETDEDGVETLHRFRLSRA
ncbi:MAG TPA: 6-bladed beta-propeller [Longimicrobium sp.]|nr:6-bladed beta-propeller [Longimicrobium sp.]